MNEYGNLLHQMYEKTTALNLNLDKVIVSDLNENDEDISNIQSLLNERDKLISAYQQLSLNSNPQWSSEEMQLLKNLEICEKQLQPKLKNIMSKLQSQYLKLQEGKKVALGYNNEGFNGEGIFIDKKK